MTVESVIIVGGGTSGWMTAAYLSKALPKLKSIKLVESASTGTIGVGEATFSTIKLFFDFLGLRERDWMPHCSASYKLAIRFVNWTKGGGHFYHPFQRFDSISGISAGEWWLKLKRGEQPFDYACFTTPHLCDTMRSPRYLDGTVYDDKVTEHFDEDRGPRNKTIAGHEVQYPYAYHFNASELARFLRDWATRRGVEHVTDDVVDVPLAEDGSIAGIVTREHGTMKADLYIDCTGFRGLLINKALAEPFISFNDTLLTDSAVAIQVPRDVVKDGIKPYTTAHAHKAGWSWNIPLYGRDGTGYVYCSRFLDKEEAEREFRAFLGPAAQDCPAKHIKMRVGRTRNSWVKNCVAIGLSSGFVEPLESTGIFFIQHGIEELVSNFPGVGAREQLMARYNRHVAECIDGVREFLTLHYVASDRDDTPFWRAVREIDPPGQLGERLAMWRSMLPCGRSIYSQFHGFESYSWAVMLMGLGHAPQKALPRLDYLEPSHASVAFDAIQAKAEHLVKTLPSQYEYLTHVRQSL